MTTQNDPQDLLIILSGHLPYKKIFEKNVDFALVPPLDNKVSNMVQRGDQGKIDFFEKFFWGHFPLGIKDGEHFYSNIFSSDVHSPRKDSPATPG